MPTKLFTVAVAAAAVVGVTALDCGLTSHYQDGWCDLASNTEVCGWDGGDCCSDTCQGHYCGSTVFACVDPSSVNQRTCNASAAVLDDISNGQCENYAAYNSLVCNWDGGDCCIKTCTPSSGAGTCETWFDCQDPRFTSGVGTGSCSGAGTCASGESSSIGGSTDDFCACDEQCTFNGDCCEDYWTTCVSGTTTDVAPTSTTTTSTASLCAAEIPEYVGDGFCDAAYNTEDCNYDGGDCCADTCTASANCGTTVYACLDPASANNNSCTGSASALSELGDGECVGINFGALNTAICGWDGGDCCSTSCNGTCAHNIMDCLDPDYSRGVGTGSCQPTEDVAAPCVTGHSSTTTAGEAEFCACSADCVWIGDCCTDYQFYCGQGPPPSTTTATASTTTTSAASTTSTTQQTSTTSDAPVECVIYVESFIGDGFCDSDYNSAACGWDEGDCCESTCTSDYQHCGQTVYACADPAASEYGTCLNVDSHQGDGSCDIGTPYNSKVCDWDGGDCCTASCPANNNGEPCVDSVYDCLDPFYSSVGTGSCAGLSSCATGESSTNGAGADDFCTCSSNCIYWGDCCADFHDYCDGYIATTPGSQAACADVVSQLSLVGDGFCDSLGAYNSRACSWDGGDCCSDSCETTDMYSCPDDVMVCEDPTSSAYVQPGDRTCEDVVSYASWIADGFCDFEGRYNSALCSWDGGDCCESTCGLSGQNCFYSEFHCLDEAATDYGSGSGECLVEFPEWLGDGICDTAVDGANYNTDACDWDLGDCCPKLDIVGERSCGDASFSQTSAAECPDYSQVADGAASPFECADPRGCQALDLGSLGNGVCNDDANTYYCGWDLGDCCASAGNGICENKFGQNSLSCGWDHGDCCVETCSTPTALIFGWECSYFSCSDPEFSDIDAGDTVHCDVSSPSFVGDGYCDAEAPGQYNTAACNWDGGDCCLDTCQANGADWVLQWNCNLTTQVCRDPTSDFSGTCSYPAYYAQFSGDGFCDQTAGMNTALCGWDGGDCCASTCEVSSYNCTSFFCLDPNSDDALQGCPALFLSKLGDGWCDSDASDYNTEKCGWDGGDCCRTSCEANALVGSSLSVCGSNSYDCLDPGFEGSTLSDCERYPSRVGDGYCDTDLELNTLSCGWDGGDCCAMTCSSSAVHTCSSDNDGCTDPAYATPVDGGSEDVTQEDNAGIIAGVICGILLVIIVVVIVVVVRQRGKRRGVRRSAPKTYVQNEMMWDPNEGIGDYTGVSL